MHLNTVEQNPVLTNGRMDHIECDLIQRSNERDSSFPINYINELMENYRELRQKSSDAGPIWGGITDGAETILEAWYSLGASSMHSNLSNMFCSPLTHGFDQGHIVSEAINHSDASKKHVLSITVDKLLLLAQSLGVAPVYNPEQGDWRFDGNFDAILSQIQARVNFDITAPIFYGGAWGIRTSFGIHSERTLMAIFIANEVSKNFSRGHSVCEIGGGSGVLAYYLHKAGFKKISIVDLPEVGFIQSYFLRRNFTDAKIYLDKDFNAN